MGTGTGVSLWVLQQLVGHSLRKACVSLLGFSRGEFLLIDDLERERRERGRSRLHTPLCYKTSAMTK